MSITQYIALLQRWKEHERGQWQRSGQISQMIANVNRAPRTPAYKLDDFIPEMFHVKHGRFKGKEITPQQMGSVLSDYFGVMFSKPNEAV